MKILVAEDHAESRAILNDLLEATGYKVALASNGNDALTLAYAELPDLIILDVNMPGKDGFMVCKELKENPQTMQIPVILLTAQSQVEDRVKGLGLGAEDFVPKPYSPRELLARVDTRLRVKRETDDLRRQRLDLRRIFERFVAPEVVEALMQHPEAAQLGGAVREITVLFADLEGFTSLSERVAPEILLEILNSYHGLTVKHIKQNQGTVDKFLGDGIMAIFNAPVGLDDHPFHAVKTAINIRQALPEFHRSLPAEFRLMVNFGIHTGPAVVGNIGTTDVMNYTAIGDTVNLAQRLQMVSIGGKITITDATYQRLSDRVQVISDGLRQVRGREELVQTYRVTGLEKVD